MATKSILFVDDDPISLQLIQDAFKKVFGKSVRYERAASAEEAEEIILENLRETGHLPALIVSDWMMPGKRGDQFLQEIARLYPEIKLVLHSGMADDGTVTKLHRNAHLLCSLPKPWDGRQHISAIYTALAS